MTTLAERFQDKIWYLKNFKRPKLALGVAIGVALIASLALFIYGIRVLAYLFSPTWTIALPHFGRFSQPFPALGVCPGVVDKIDPQGHHSIEPGKIDGMNCSYIKPYQKPDGSRGYNVLPVLIMAAKHHIEYRDYNCFNVNYDAGKTPILTAADLGSFIACRVQSDAFVQIMPYHQERSQNREFWEEFHPVPQNDASRLYVSTIEFKRWLSSWSPQYYYVERIDDELHLKYDQPPTDGYTVFSVHFSPLGSRTITEFIHFDFFYSLAVIAAIIFLAKVFYHIIVNSVAFLAGLDYKTHSERETTTSGFSSSTTATETTTTKSGGGYGAL